MIIWCEGGGLTEKKEWKPAPLPPNKLSIYIICLCTKIIVNSLEVFSTKVYEVKVDSHTFDEESMFCDKKNIKWDPGTALKIFKLSQ